MPPIKRTKFKLSPEQLLEMFYWLKLIRAFDKRLSILVKQGKVRSGVYTGIGQEAIIVGTCYGLRREDFICPLHRDLGSFLMKGVESRVMMAQMFAKETGLSKGRDSALHSGVSELGIFGIGYLWSAGNWMPRNFCSSTSAETPSSSSALPYQGFKSS